MRSQKGWKTIGENKIYFRSSWEVLYAKFLQKEKTAGRIKDWSYEPYTFWFEGIRRGCVTYLPDFKVIRLDGSHYWVEVKGWMNPKSKTKIKRFGKYFPEEKLVIIDRKWFKSLSKGPNKRKCHMSHKKKPMLKNKMKAHIKEEFRADKKLMKEDMSMMKKMKGKC